MRLRGLGRRSPPDRKRESSAGRKSPLIGVLTGHPSPTGRRLPSGLWTTAPRSASSSPRGEPRSPRNSAGLPDGGQPSGTRSAAGRGRDARRGERRVLLQGGTRQPRRRLRRSPRGHRPRPAPRRGGAHASVPTCPRRQRNHGNDGPSPPYDEALDAPTEPAVDPRRHHRRAGDRPERPDGPARGQPSRAGDALVDVRRTIAVSHRTSPATRFSWRTSHRFYPSWDLAADTCVAILRTEAGRDPHDKGLHDLVGELSTRSERVPAPLELAQRPSPRHRRQAVPPRHRRRAHPRVREPRSASPNPDSP